MRNIRQELQEFLNKLTYDMGLFESEDAYKLAEHVEKLANIVRTVLVTNEKKPAADLCPFCHITMAEEAFCASCKTDFNDFEDTN